MIKLMSVLRRRWSLLLLCFVIGVSAGVLSSIFAGNKASQDYTAEQIVLGSESGGPQDALTVTRGEIPVAAAKKLHTDVDPNQLAASIVVVYDDKTNALTFATNDTNPDLAVKRVGAFVDAFLEVSNARFQSSDREKLDQINKDIASTTQALKDFDAAHPEFTQAGFQPPNDIVTADLLSQRRTLVERSNQLATEKGDLETKLSQSAPYTTLGPERPKPASTGLIGVPTSKLVRGWIGGLLGLLLGGALVMIVERLGRRIDTREELAEVTDLPVLAEIAYLPEKRRGSDAEGRVALSGVWAEPYRRVRSAVHFVQTRPHAVPSTSGPPPGQRLPGTGSVFLVTSTSPAEGKSTTATLLSIALAESGTPTVLVGGDFRKPQVDRLIDVKPSPSLQDFARLDVDRPSVDDVVQQTRFDDLYAVVSGPGTREVAGLIDAATEVCREAVARGATVIVDSSPVKAANDTIDLLTVVDYVILVVRAGQSTEKEFLDTIALLRRLDARILGVVLIGTRSSQRRAYYYYEYYGPPPDAGTVPVG